MADSLKLEIVTPEGKLYSDDVEMVTLPAVMGQMGVYPLHTPVTAQMEPGEIIIHKDGRDLFFATGEGLIEVTAHRVSVLTDLAIAADRIDEAKAEEAKRRAEARLQREALGRGSRFRQCLAGTLPGSDKSKAPSAKVDPNARRHWAEACLCRKRISPRHQAGERVSYEPYQVYPNCFTIAAPTSRVT